jgi:hypothetical protein
MDRYDILVFVGLILLATGLWLHSPALALVVVGLILLATGIYGVTR